MRKILNFSGYLLFFLDCIKVFAFIEVHKRDEQINVDKKKYEKIDGWIERWIDGQNKQTSTCNKKRYEKLKSNPKVIDIDVCIRNAGICK